MMPEIERALEGGGHRLTAQRRLVVRELERSRRPLSAEQLRDRIRRGYPQVNLSTVYGTLKLLKRVGVAHRKSFGKCGSRYELRAGKPRHHALCLSCGAVIECHEFLPDLANKWCFSLLDYLALRLEREMGFFADSYELTLHGYCAAHEPTAARQAAPTSSPTKVAKSQCRRRIAAYPMAGRRHHMNSLIIFLDRSKNQLRGGE